MKQLLALVALILGLLAPLVSAEELQLVQASGSLTYAVPKQSPVRFSSIGQYGVAYFEGRFLLKGTYHYGYLTDDPNADAAYGVLDLYFLPDKDISALLPYWHQHPPVHEIRFQNAQQFVKAVVPARVLNQLQAKERFSVSGRAAVWVDSYRASVDCDYPTYSVRFVSVDVPPTIEASREFVDQYGC
ncbi:MAG TPA: hypothetical protein VMH32_22575 [Burkholderiales bacterium]|nr:hypothetical protein [Burkholderiales bacterium]